MALALTLGRRGLGNAWPNPAVGAVVVKDGVVVGRGWTQPGGRPHAEVEALRRAGAAARGATLYATLEPCSHHGKTPPCVDAIAAAGIARVVSALEDPNPEIAGQGHARLTSQGIAVDDRRVRRRSAARARGTHSARPRWPATCHAQARRVGRRQGGACRPQAGRDHRRAGARARAADARHERCGGDRDRNGAGRRSPAHLPAARDGATLAGARGAGQCVADAGAVEACGLGDAHARLGIRRREGEARARGRVDVPRAWRCCAYRARTDSSIWRQCCAGLPAAGSRG